MSIRVSIIVPVYNSHATLSKCLDSLIAQTWQDLEIICVNDKSTDNSLDIIKEYLQEDNRVKLINHAENLNAGGARNSGIKAATGEYVCFCDNDDWMAPDAIEMLVGASEGGRVDFVVSQWCQYWNEKRMVDMQNLIVGGTKDDNCNYALLNGCRILGCLIRRDIFIKNDLFFPEKTFFEDNAIGLCLLFCANNIKVVDNVLYYYQMVGGSSSRSISMVKIIDRIKTTNLFVENLERLGFVSTSNKSLIEYCYLCYTYYTIRMLAGVGTNEAKQQLSIVAEKCKSLMPNVFISKCKKGFEGALKHPYLYYQIWKMAYKVKRLLRK